MPLAKSALVAKLIIRKLLRWRSISSVEIHVRVWAVKWNFHHEYGGTAARHHFLAA
jgi:hypothetical protein